MISRPSRRDVVKTTVTLAAMGSLGVSCAGVARAKGSPRSVGTFSDLDGLLRAATSSGELPGVVVLATSKDDLVYEGVFGKRRLEAGPAMTRDTVFRIASMVKLI